MYHIHIDFRLSLSFFLSFLTRFFDFHFQIGLPKDSKLSAPDNRLVCPSESSPQTKKDEDVSAAKVETSAERRSTEPNDGTESQVRDAAFITNQLVHPAKMSQIIWKQTAEMVVITIAAPDVKDYYLRVASRSVHFR